MENRPIAEKQRRKLTNGREEKLDQKIWCGFRKKYLKQYCKCFQKSKQKLYIWFSLYKRQLNNLKTVCRRTEIIDLILEAFKILFSPRPSPFKLILENGKRKD
jgi:hypothetical protein